MICVASDELWDGDAQGRRVAQEMSRSARYGVLPDGATNDV